MPTNELATDARGHERDVPARHEGVAGASATAFEPGAALTPASAPALHAAVGNATIARLVQRERATAAPSAVRLARAPAGTAPAPTKQALQPADKAKLDTAKRLVDTAKVNKDIALDAMSRYSGSAPKHLAALKSDADKNLVLYRAAANQVNYIISEAKEIAKIQQEVLMTVVGAAIGGIGGLVKPMAEEAQEIYDITHGKIEKLKTDLEAFKLPDVAGEAKKGVVGEKAEGGDAVSKDPAEQELEFYKNFANLQSNSTKVLGVGVAVGRIGEPIGRVDEAIAGILNSGMTRSDYPIDMLTKDAARLADGVQALGAAGPKIDKLLSELQASVAQSNAAMPKDDKEVEKALWKHWAAGLDHGTDFKQLDLDVVEKYLTRLGIWKELGIDIGNWFSSEEQILTVGSAKAHEMVTQGHEAVEFEPGAGFGKVEIGSIKTKIPARLDKSSKFFTKKVRAVVIGAETIGSEGAVDTKVLKEVPKNKDGDFTAKGIAEYLLRNGYVRAVLRSYEDLSNEEGAEKAG